MVLFGKNSHSFDGLHDYCRGCVAKKAAERYRVNLDKSRELGRAYTKKNRPSLEEMKEIRARDRVKFAARRAIFRAVENGELLKPEVCQRCGDNHRVEGHHDDYAKPLDVLWLCTACHRRRHEELAAAGIIP